MSVTSIIFISIIWITFCSFWAIDKLWGWDAILGLDDFRWYLDELIDNEERRER